MTLALGSLFPKEVEWFHCSVLFRFQLCFISYSILLSEHLSRHFRLPYKKKKKHGTLHKISVQFFLMFYVVLVNRLHLKPLSRGYLGNWYFMA